MQILFFLANFGKIIRQKKIWTKCQIFAKQWWLPRKLQNISEDSVSVFSGSTCFYCVPYSNRRRENKSGKKRKRAERKNYKKDRTKKSDKRARKKFEEKNANKA